MMDVMNMLLVRHASNDWIGKRLAGRLPAIHLNDQGRAEALALADRLAKVPLSAVYASPLERTVETAQPLAAAHNLDMTLNKELSETDFGSWAGQTLEELRKEKLWTAVQFYPGGTRFPGGESFRESQARVVAELDAIRDSHAGETVAAVFHSDPIKMAVAHYAGIPLDLFQRIVISPASVTAFSFSAHGPRLVCLNVTNSLPTFQPLDKGQH